MLTTTEVDEDIRPLWIPPRSYCQVSLPLESNDDAAAAFRELCNCAQDSMNYVRARCALLRLGDKARQELRSCLASEASIQERAIADGVLYELNHPKESQRAYMEMARYVPVEMLREAFGDAEFEAEYDAGSREPKAKNPRQYGRRLIDVVAKVRPSSLHDIPAPLLVEYLATETERYHVDLLEQVRDNAIAFEMLSRNLLQQRSQPTLVWQYRGDAWQPRHDTGPDDTAIVPLALQGGEQALDVYRSRIRAFPLSAPTIHRLAEATMQIGGRKAGLFLDELLDARNRHAEFHGDWEAETIPLSLVARILQNEPANLATILNSENAAYAMAAAKVLARNKDPKCVPVLFSFLKELAERGYTGESGFGFGGMGIGGIRMGGRMGGGRAASGFGFAGQMEGKEILDDFDSVCNWFPELFNPDLARNAIVRIGEPAIPAIDLASRHRDNIYSAILGKALKLRINRPNLAPSFDEAFQSVQGYGRGGGHVGPDEEDYLRAGQDLAKQVGPEGIPLLEFACAWEPNAQSAMYALAQFQQRSSLAFILAHRETQDLPIPGEVLIAFGKAGVLAAREAPDLNPEEMGGAHVARHLAAVEALAAANDPAAIDKLVDALKLSAADKGKPYHLRVGTDATRRYLDVAISFQDDRLLDLILAALDAHGNDIAGPAALALAHYDDPRLEPLFLKYLRADWSKVMDALVTLKGDELPELLVNELNKMEDPEIEPCLLWGLSSLGGEFGHLRRDRISPKAYQHLIPEIQAVVIERIQAPEGNFQSTAADTLAQFQHHNQIRDEAITKLLVDWMLHHVDLPGRVKDYLLWEQSEVAISGLRRLYDMDRDKFRHLDSWIRAAESSITPSGR